MEKDEFYIDGETGERKRRGKCRTLSKYEPGFLARLDSRLAISRILTSAFDEVTDDMGGKESLSHAQLALAERFCFLEFVLRRIESRIASNPKKTSALLGKWIQGLNSLTGLARAIGLERRAKKIESLETYLIESKNGKRKKS